MLYDIADTAEVMRWYRELQPSLPEELSGWIGLLTIPPAPPFPEELWGRKACGIVWCYTGPHDKADEVLAPVKSSAHRWWSACRRCRSRAAERVRRAVPRRAAVVLECRLLRGDLRRGHRRPQRVRRAAADRALDHAPVPDRRRGERVSDDATAFAYRDGGWAGVIVGVDPDPANADAISQWARDYWDELHPTSAGGAYVNFMMEEGSDRVKASYRGNYERLSKVKDRYDPDNVFHINQNIVPVGQASG